MYKAPIKLPSAEQSVSAERFLQAQIKADGARPFEKVAFRAKRSRLHVRLFLKSDDWR
jgi:hypothetical protein